jgi:hypothetical protein
MIDSALGLNPDDMSEAAKAKRILRGFADLNGITFVAKIRIEPSSDPRYGDSNKLDRVILPTEPEWKKVMDGQDVPAAPSTLRRKPASAPTAPAAPAWSQPQQQAAPTPAAPAATQGPAWLNG